MIPIPVKLIKFLWFSGDAEFHALIQRKSGEIAKEINLQPPKQEQQNNIQLTSHRDAIISILKNNPQGLSVGEIKIKLDEIRHPISSRVLHVSMSQLKEKGGVRTEGRSPCTRFFAG